MVHVVLPAEAILGDRVSPAEIRRSLVSDIVGRRIYVLEEVASTNDVLRGLAAAGAPDGTVLFAEEQTAARGRRGQQWLSPPGVNLYASVLFRPPIRPAAVPVFSCVTSLALTEAVWAEGLPAAIKWPNDVFVRGRKIAGTLGESTAVAERVDHVILGVGVNVNVSRAALDAGLGAAAAGATSLAIESGRVVDRNGFAAAFLGLLDTWYRRYLGQGAEPVLETWRDRDVLTGRWVAVRGGGTACEGLVLGVDDEGYLVVREAGGAARRVSAAQITQLA